MQQVIVDFGEVSPFGWTIGVRLYGYGLMLVLGFLCGIYLARWRARRFGEDPDTVTTIGLLALLGGVVGARLAFVIERWDSQFARQDNPLLEVFNITSGGLIYYGGVALAAVVVLVYLRGRRVPIRRYLDIIAPSLMIGLAFGRAGCTLNGCCHGGPCREDHPLAMRFPYAAKPLLRVGAKGNVFGGASVTPVFAHQIGTGRLKGAAAPDWLFHADAAGRSVLKSPADLTEPEAQKALKLRSLPVKPAQVLGAVNALLIAAVLLVFTRLRRREGQVFALMVICYPITRFVLESIRGDNPHDVLSLTLTHNQHTSLGLMAFGVMLWFLLRRLPPAAGPFWSDRLAAARSHPSRPHRQRKGKR